MLIDNETPFDLNVCVTVFNEKKEQVQKLHIKNTATKRMTDAIALFLAGDAGTYESRDANGGPAAGKGRWRPNFISFGTTGIDQQPTTENPMATVLDPEAFADTDPAPGVRTRPWFYSTMIGELKNKYWNPKNGWATDPEHPDVANFQGELATCYGYYTDDELNTIDWWVDNQATMLYRQPILRADVTTDYAGSRELAQENYNTDCILYGYSSVKWVDYFFEPPVGPGVPRIAISEVGLYETDTNQGVGPNTLMAGFRVPSVDDIIYVSPGYVILVEWRVTIRAIMPYERVISDSTRPVPTGVSIKVQIENTEPGEDYELTLTALVHGSVFVSQKVLWSLVGDHAEGTYIEQLSGSDIGYLTVSKNESNPAIYVKCASKTHDFIWSQSAIITGLIQNYISGITLSIIEVHDTSMLLKATVMGKGIFTQNVTWAITYPDGSPCIDTTISSQPESMGLIEIGNMESGEEFKVVATSTDNPNITSVAAIVRIDKTAGTYVVSDFTILTD